MNLKVYILDEVKIKTTRILLQHDVKNAISYYWIIVWNHDRTDSSYKCKKFDAEIEIINARKNLQRFNDIFEH